MLKKSYIYGVLSLVMLTTCMKNELPFISETENENKLSLQYEVEKLRHNGEDIIDPGIDIDIHTLYLIFFEYSTNGSGKLVDICHVKPDQHLADNPAGMVYIDLPKLAGIENKDYNVLVAANAEFYTRANDFYGTSEEIAGLMDYFKDYWKEKSEKDISQMAFFRLDSGKIMRSNLPMSGRTVKRSGSNEVAVKLSRSVSRIDITNKDDDYELVSAALWNVYPRTHVWEHNFSNFVQEKHINRFSKFYSDNQTGNEVTGQLYTFENHVPNTQQNDTLITCLIVGMRRVNAKEHTEYYRINLSPTKGSQILKRNHLYQVTINKVLGNGKGSETDAYKSIEILLNGHIHSWEEDNFSNIQFDGDKVLHLSHSKVNFPTEGGVQSIIINTRGTGHVEISQQILPGSITAGLNKTKDRLDISAGKTFDEQRGLVEIRFGELRASVEVIQEGIHSEWLEVSPATLTPFSSTFNSGKTEQVIEVTANGEWIAQLYDQNGDQRFSLNKKSPIKTLIGKGRMNFNVYLCEDNENTEPKYSFLTVSLKDNPAVSRVLLLTQEKQTN